MRSSSLCFFVSFESRHIYDQTANVLYNYGYGYVQRTMSDALAFITWPLQQTPARRKKIKKSGSGSSGKKERTVIMNLLAFIHPYVANREWVSVNSCFAAIMHFGMHAVSYSAVVLLEYHYSNWSLFSFLTIVKILHVGRWQHVMVSSFCDYFFIYLYITSANYLASPSL